MEYLIQCMKNNRLQSIGKKISAADIVAFQKKLTQAGYPVLPEGFMTFLKLFNGLEADESGILGINTGKDYLNIFDFNQTHNEHKEALILAYDDFSFLVYHEPKKKYLLVDRYGTEVIDEYNDDELDLALGSMLHLENE